jgi:hypothetical protein
MCAQRGNPGGVHDDPWPSQALSFGPGVTETSLYALGYQTSFQFGNRPQYRENHLTGRGACVHLLTKRDEFYAQGFEGFKCPQKVGNRPGEPVESPDDYGVEAPPVGVGHKPVQFRSAVFSARDSLIGVLTGKLPASSLAILAQLASLHLGVLAVVCRGDSSVDRGPSWASVGLFFV